MSGIGATLGKLLEDILIADGNEAPGLGIFRALRTPPGVENRLDGLIGKRLLGEAAHRAFGANGV